MSDNFSGINSSYQKLYRHDELSLLKKGTINSATVYVQHVNPPSKDILVVQYTLELTTTDDVTNEIPGVRMSVFQRKQNTWFWMIGMFSSSDPFTNSPH